MVYVENLSAYFDPSTPGVYPATFGTTEINVEFEPDFYETFDVDEGYMPRIGCIEDEVSGIKLGDTITITEGAPAGTYLVRDIRGQHTGVLNLRVQKQ